MEEIITCLIGAALVTAWLTAVVKKGLKAAWPKLQLDATWVGLIQAAANFVVAYIAFGDRYSMIVLALASLVVAS